MLGRSEKKNVCAECRHYENCGRPERFMKCLGYEKAVNAERKDNDRCKIVDAPTTLHMKCSVRMLIPIIDRKLRERGL